MSTPPFTLVVGEIRMPRLRPLELVSRSLGREWSLLPPNVSFRTELKALYAAMLRTFCLSAAAIRSMCQWDPASLHQPSSTPLVPLKPDAIALGIRAPMPAPAHGSRQWNTLAGGACAIGGAAVIAWLMAAHPRGPASPQLAAAPEVTLNAAANQVANQVVNQSANVERTADVSRAWNRARSERTTRQLHDATALDPSGESPGRASSAALTQPAIKAPRTAAPREIDAVTSLVPKSEKAFATNHAPQSAGKASSTTREHVTIASTAARGAPHTTVHAPNVAQRANASASAKARSGRQADAHFQPEKRVRHWPSAAGAYSPSAPSPRLDNEYDSVRMSARTTDIGSLTPRAGSVNTDSTEWMNHMSQRRVTEVPDRFSK